MGHYRAGDTDHDTEMYERKPSILIKNFIDTGPKPVAFQESDSEDDEIDPFEYIPLLPQPPSPGRIAKTFPKRKTALSITVSLPPSISPPLALRRPKKSGYTSPNNWRSRLTLIQSDMKRKPPTKSLSLDDSTTQSLRAHIYSRQPSLKVEGTRKERSQFKVHEQGGT